MLRVRDSLYELMVMMYGYDTGVRSLGDSIEINLAILVFIALLLFLPPHLRIKAVGYMVLGTSLGIAAGRLIPTWDWLGFAVIIILALVLTKGR